MSTWSMSGMIQTHAQAMLVVAFALAGMVRGVGAQTPPLVGATDASSASAAEVAPSGSAPSGSIGAPEPAPIGTAAYPGNEVSPAASGDVGAAPNAPARMMLGPSTPATVQAQSQDTASVVAEKRLVSDARVSGDGAARNPNWSVGAGLGWTFASPLLLDTSPSLSPAGAYTPIGAFGMMQQSSPTAMTFLEYRLGDGIFALAQPEVSYVRNHYPTQEKASYASSFALGLGLRWVGNPHAPVEVGMAHSVYMGRASAGAYYNGTLSAEGITTPAISWATPSTTSVGTASAVVVERMLLPQLWLRISATVLRISWSKSEAHYELENGATYGGESRKAFGAKFGFDPTVSLRLTF